jgi:hypothetical protein
MMKKLFEVLFKPKKGKVKGDALKVNLNKFKEDLHERLSKIETKTFLYDYQQTIGQLYMMDKIDYEKALKERESNMDKLTETMEKAREAEMLINSSFFNNYSLEILNNTDNKDLVDLACMSFVGNTGGEICLYRYSERCESVLCYFAARIEKGKNSWRAERY